jgi:hypothetical protein
MSNHTNTRRSFLKKTAITTAIAGSTLAQEAFASNQAPNQPTFKIAPFRFDVTPPTGHPLCGGWITPVKSVSDNLEAIGYVILGLDKPVVVCAVDWTGILNSAHVAWRTALAQAAGTTPTGLRFTVCTSMMLTLFASMQKN